MIGGFSKIDVDAKNSINGSVKEGSVLGFSPGVAVGFHYDTFGIFVAAGTDFAISNEIAAEWRYKKQLWLGFGVGFSIF